MRIGSKFCNLQLELSSDNKSQSDVIDRPLSFISSSGLSSNTPASKHLHPLFVPLVSVVLVVIFRSVFGQCREYQVQRSSCADKSDLCFAGLGRAGGGGRCSKKDVTRFHLAGSDYQLGE